MPIPLSVCVSIHLSVLYLPINTCLYVYIGTETQIPIYHFYMSIHNISMCIGIYTYICLCQLLERDFDFSVKDEVSTVTIVSSQACYFQVFATKASLSTVIFPAEKEKRYEQII